LYSETHRKNKCYNLSIIGCIIVIVKPEFQILTSNAIFILRLKTFQITLAYVIYIYIYMSSRSIQRTLDYLNKLCSICRIKIKSLEKNII